MNDVLNVSKTAIRNKNEFKFTECEFLEMAYFEEVERIHYNDMDRNRRVGEEQVKRFYYVLVRNNKIVLYNYSSSYLGFYKFGSKKDCPLIKEDILNSSYLTDEMNDVEKEEYLNNLLDETNNNQLNIKLRKYCGAAELLRKRGEILELSFSKTSEYIRKEEYLHRRDEILESIGFKRLCDDSEILQQENNMFAPILNKMLSYHKKLIKFIVLSPKKIEAGQMGVTQTGDAYINLGKFNYNIDIDGNDVSEYSFSMPKYTDSYYTYLELSSACKSSLASIHRDPNQHLVLDEKIEQMRQDFENNCIEKYVTGIKIVKTPLKASRIIQLVDVEDLDIIEKIDLDLTLNNKMYINLIMNNASDMLYNVKIVSFTKQVM